VDLPLPYPQLEHLVGEDRRVDYGGPLSDLKLAFWRRGSTVKVQSSHIKRVSEAYERLMANSPYGEKAPSKKCEAGTLSRTARTRPSVAITLFDCV
jgi:hypothetical protein